MALQLALYKRAEAHEKVEKLLADAMDVWQSKANNSTALAFLLEARAQSLMEAGEMNEAAKCLSQLRDEYRPDDMALLVKLVKTTSVYDPEVRTHP
eukprot:scaffold229944_cov21-Prasinocladus_malaysianus.AAC.1